MKKFWSPEFSLIPGIFPVFQKADSKFSKVFYLFYANTFHSDEPKICSCEKESIIKSSLFNSFPNKPCFSHICSTEVFRKHCGKRRNCLLRAISPFPTVFSTHLEFLLFSLNLKLLSANSFSLEESKICCLGKG